MKKNANKQATIYHCPNCGAPLAPDSLICRYCGSPVAVQVCPRCFGICSAAMKYCPHCGARLTKSQPEKTGLQCPRCKSKLVLIKVGGHTMHMCERCGGLWLNKADFHDICTQTEEQEAVLGLQKTLNIPAPLNRRPKRTYIPCPECGKLMNHRNFAHCSGVVLDWCAEHGNWFDRNELQRIVAFIRNGGLRKARERKLSELKEREADLRRRELQGAILRNRLDSGLRGDEFRSGSDALLKVLNGIFG